MFDLESQGRRYILSNIVVVVLVLVLVLVVVVVVVVVLRCCSALLLLQLRMPRKYSSIRRSPVNG